MVADVTPCDERGHAAGVPSGFVGPVAVLCQGDEDGEFGIHYGGPTWESASGSKGVGMVARTADAASRVVARRGATTRRAPPRRHAR